MSYSRRRQRFLVNQGYCYKVITKLVGMEEEQLSYPTKHDQLELLQQVLAASDADAEEEEGKGDEDFAAGGRQDGKLVRKRGDMGSLSGAHNLVYAQVDKKKLFPSGERHPLFRRFKTK